MNDQEFYCSICRADTLFTPPPCPEGHEPECPELLCNRCGAAMLVEPLVVRAWLQLRGAGIAPQQRRAA